MKRFSGAAIGLAILAGSGGAHAITPQFDTWYAFDVYQDMGGSPWVDENLDPFVLDVTTATPIRVRVADAGFAGDRFNVSVDGASSIVTTVPGDAGDVFQDDFDAAFADGRWSRAEFTLGAGTYRITGSALSFAPDVIAATGGILISAVPEPGTWALTAAGGLLVAASLYRRRH